MRFYPDRMELKEIYKKLTESGDFKQWKDKNPKTYLVHFFKVEEENRGEWQMGYYDKEKDRITTFLVTEQIGIIPEQEVYKEKKVIKKLDISKIKIDEEKAFTAVEEVIGKNYKGEFPIKKIIIIQNLGRGAIWNITFLIRSFKTLNFKINAETGKVLSHELNSLMDFVKK